MFGRDYGRDFTDALLISMTSAVVAGLLFVAGFFAPVLLLPAAIIGVAIMVVGVPLLVQTFKSQDDGPEPSLALLHF